MPKNFRDLKDICDLLVFLRRLGTQAGSHTRTGHLMPDSKKGISAGRPRVLKVELSTASDRDEVIGLSHNLKRNVY